MGKGFQIADDERFRKVLDRMATSIGHRMTPDLQIVGIRRRGVPIAERLAERLEEQSGAASPPDVREIVLKRYADDLTVLHDRPALKETPDLDIDGDRPVLLVDDVLYTGRTLFRAVEVIAGLGAEHIMTAVLCSRGENDFPIRGNFVGRHLDVGPENVIEVHVPPYENEAGIFLFHKEDLGTT